MVHVLAELLRRLNTAVQENKTHLSAGATNLHSLHSSHGGGWTPSSHRAWDRGSDPNPSGGLLRPNVRESSWSAGLRCRCRS